MAEIITLGEIMLRLSSNVGERLEQANSLAAHYGGGEANVAVSLANFGHTVYFASKIPDNLLGKGVLQHLKKHAVLTDYLLVGGTRLGTYYVETGIGERAAQVIYDRSNSSFAAMQDNEWKSKNIFQGKDIFHVSGITPALSLEWQDMTIHLIKEAKQANCKISFDINYRSKLWSQKHAKVFLEKALPLIDYCSAGKLDALYLLDIPACEGIDNELVYYYKEIQKKYTNISCLYSTKREVISASEHRLTGTLWTEQGYFKSQTYHIQPIVDRIGTGDAFTAGILHGLLTFEPPQKIINFATAAAALKHTVDGDSNLFTEEEVWSYLSTGSGKIVR